MAAARKPIEALRKKLPKPPTTLVMQERPFAQPRATHRHHRGEFLSPREVVRPEGATVPAAAGQGSVTRIASASPDGLVDPRNPLTARVVVNRYWAALFGRGLVRTPDDFGYTGICPRTRCCSIGLRWNSCGKVGRRKNSTA